MDVKAIIQDALAGNTEAAAAKLKAILNKKKDELKEESKLFLTASVLEADTIEPAAKTE